MNAKIGARPYHVRTRRGYASMLLDRNRPGDCARAAELIAAAMPEAEQLGMAREIVVLNRLRQRLNWARHINGSVAKLLGGFIGYSCFAAVDGPQLKIPRSATKMA